ncbi:Vacuolar protein sorting-associated protein 41 [Fusarium torreyae]|uniref:Vacuolar protein sorting-associated protein 41 n=1 Tax=Fusarium torreyae TaxID=1237075 RepID=A0A9W8RWA8_9HYPO|nr:Vacuolar protein sorting-associated protein 41 [Fusarium torreyae]
MTDQSPQPSHEQARDPEAQQSEHEPAHDISETVSPTKEEASDDSGQDKHASKKESEDVNESLEVIDVKTEEDKKGKVGQDGDNKKEEEDDDDEEDGEEDDEEEDDDDEEDEDDDEDEEDEEPKLKYARLTQHLNSVYRNGDATSAFLVAGDKMIVGTHNGNIHIVQLPMFQSMRVYHAHSASVTSISISPYPPPLPTEKPEAAQRLTAPSSASVSSGRQADSSPAAASRRPREAAQIPKIPSNDIYVATSSLDGNVCVQHLIDMKDVQLRNFARPVQAVALSPEFKTDRTYLSGGLAGQLILTTGGGPGRSTSTTTGTAAAAASGWLGSMGLGSNTGKDTILHSGEGAISTIKWSLSGKYVVWLNEHGIKIMRSKLHLESADAEDAWKRVGHIDRPQTDEWETMAGVWKGRVEWIDEQAVEVDESDQSLVDKGISPATDKPRETAVASKKGIERLLVGWGGTIWIIHVHPGGVGVGRHAGEKTVGRAEIVKILRMDCIISGISLYTQNLLLVLAYCLPEGDDEDEDTGSVSISPVQRHKSNPSTGSEPSGGIHRRQNNQPPELRLIDLNSQAEADKDSLSVSRYERLSSGDYHLGVLPARNAASAIASSRGALEAIAGIGTDMWNAAINPRSLFSSGASIRSRESGDDSSLKAGSTAGTIRPGSRGLSPTVHSGLVKPGVKIFIHSPYDCILATRRDLSDHLGWLLERQQYQRAWELLDEHPEIMSPINERASDGVSTPTRQGAGDDFFDDESVPDSQHRDFYSSAEREKRRIGELWIQELIEENDWVSAGKVCGQVLKTPDRWEKWVWTFAGAKRFDDITNYIPTEPMHPPLPSTIYEVVLGHYIQNDKPRFRELLDRWSPELFDIKTITTALENQLKYRDVREDSVDDGEKGRDWRIVMESLARLHEANGRQREALKCYIKLHDADSVFRLIRDNHLAEAVEDDIPSFIGLRVPPGKMDEMTAEELEQATSEAITLLVDEAQHGLLRPDVVVEQLLAQKLDLYIYLYFRGLWRGEGIQEHTGENVDRLVMDSQSLVDNFADLAVHLFATFDQPLLMQYLKTSVSYTFDKAVQECETFSYYDELVFLYSKTGQMKRALYLIIDRLKNVHKAIEFAKEQDDPDLWEDLLKYSMDKPSFIRGLLEQVGTAINPITVVQRIPEGLEIEGLREGLTHMMKEHEIQYSISSGVARVLRSEVASAQNDLRAGQRKGIKFEVVVQENEHVDVEVKDVPTDPDNPERNASHASTSHDHRVPKPGHCARCHEPFTEYEMETLVGYACGHVFHVSHLLEMLHRGKKVDVDLGNGSEEGSRYSVGMKVMRARLLKDKMRGGCPVCHVKE